MVLPETVSSVTQARLYIETSGLYFLYLVLSELGGGADAAVKESAEH